MPRPLMNELVSMWRPNNGLPKAPEHVEGEIERERER